MAQSQVILTIVSTVVIFLLQLRFNFTDKDTGLKCKYTLFFEKKRSNA